jgi:hypothetical protein
MSYVPDGQWPNTAIPNPATGVQLVPIEGTGSRATISTRATVNSCASNSVTSETVCTANNTDIYLINGSTVTQTVSSNGVGTVSFTGGACTNCGVVIDPTVNFAVIGLSLSTSPGGSGFQGLFLGTPVTPFPPVSTQNANISESFALDPIHGMVLSPSEEFNGFAANFQILEGTGLAAKLFNFRDAATTFAAPNNLLDSAAVDCTTQIALATVESIPAGTQHLFITDLKQATFTPPVGTTPGTWFAPNQIQNFAPAFANFTAGTTGIAVAPAGHVGILEDEFGSTAFAAFRLPSTSGTGTPAVKDWVSANMPNDPTGAGWVMSLDPHGLTAYISPNTGKPMGLITNLSATFEPTFIAVVDIEALLAAPRSAPGSHVVSPTVDLVATGVVRFVSIH